MATPRKRKPQESTPRLAYLIGRVDRLVRRGLEDALADADISLAQYTAMSVLAARPGLSNAQLARRSLITPQAMHQALAELDGRKLIERKPHPTQGRVLCIELTDTGFDVLTDLDKAIDTAEQHLMAPLSNSQRADLLAALDALARIGGQ